MDQSQMRDQKSNDEANSRSVNKSTSLGTLLAWNISKALEKNPHIDLKSAIKAAQVRMERDVNVVISQCPEERHVECALLAWQQLGHSDADSLYKFYEKKKIDLARKATIKANKTDLCAKMADDKPYLKTICNNIGPTQSIGTDSTSFISYSVGPVVKLPTQTNIVMRMENTGSVRQTCKKPRADEKNIMNKIDAACCLDSVCIERLSTLDATTSELRLRASKLAKREAERAELLERAEAAWRNLELGYHRRLSLSEEKEDDITKQIQKLMEERNNYKNVCMTLVQQLKVRGDLAEKEREKLTEVEKVVYDRACVRLRLSEQVAREESALAEQHCRAAQMDRDLQFKEEEARRKLRNYENEMESTRALTHDTERAMRAELGAIKEQVAHVSKQLLDEDAETARIRKELEELQLEKMGMVEDLDGCQAACDKGMQGKMDELKKKKQQLNELNEKVIECRCKFPIDATVEVKRTPSLAALCQCTPEDKILESCSCTSLRSQLLSNLLADLFGGLLNELGSTGPNMPCQLLKCLEDKHNWDRSSVLKTNLRSFFARLLMGELDIAIATSIEKYHAKWVGATCADIARVIPDTCQAGNIGWQERAMERRAQKLATQLAEQLFQDRADQLTQRAKDVIATGPPPCECRPQSAVYSCIVKAPLPTIDGSKKNAEGMSPFWRRTSNDVTQLRLQVEDLKKDSIKKADLKIIEDRIAKLVKRSHVSENINGVTTYSFDNTPKSIRAINVDCTASKRKSSFINNPKKGSKKVTNMKIQMDKTAKSFNKLKQTFAVNLCLCGTQTGVNKTIPPVKRMQNANGTDEITLIGNDDKNSWKQNPSNAATSQMSPMSQMSSVRKTKPINNQLPNTEISTEKHSKIFSNTLCKKDCVCFHKKPSSTSIDKLLETIAKWKNDLTDLSIKKGDIYKMNQPSMSNEKSLKDKKSSKVSYKFDDPEQTSIGKSIKGSGMSSNKENKKSSDASCCKQENDGNLKDSEIRGVLPRTTESEYIGAVNLDKSNENFCKCDKTGNQDKCMDNSKFPNKCINFSDCFCKKSSQNVTIVSEKVSTGPIPSSKGCPGSKKRKNLKEAVPIETTVEPPDKEPEIKSKEEFSCDCDITLLGVTLANKKLGRGKKSRIYDCSYSDDDYDGGNDCNRSSKFNRHKVKRSGRSSRRNNLDDLTKPSCNKPRPSCRCNNNFDEVKDFICNVCTEQKGPFIPHVDKGIEVIETIESEHNEECICCNINDKIETKNLEENTFHLIEEHLKQKLEEFKSTSCKSSCISSEEGEKIFSTILQKVRQIVLDTTYNISCRCSSQPPTEGSWNRAYSLLQEYLKAKIQRIHCQCSVKEGTSPIDNVLERVCNLIQQDFDRLKSICKCKSMQRILEENAQNNQILCDEETPVKDMNLSMAGQVLCTFKRNTADETTTINKSQSKLIEETLKANILTENMSSQVPLNLGMETKSCNVIEKDTVKIQTSEIKKLSAYNDCDVKISRCNYDCWCDFDKNECQKDKSVLGFGTTELLVNHCTKLSTEEYSSNFTKSEFNSKSFSYPTLHPKSCRSAVKENLKIYGEHPCDDKVSKKIKLPYVGYTVDCSCDNKIGTCICMKSIIQKNNDKIIDTWKTYMDNNNSKMKNISYILNTTPCKPTIIVDKVEEENRGVLNLNPEQISKHNICEVKLSTHGEEDIILKHSCKNIDDVHSAACNVESVSTGTNYLNEKDSLDWCECSSRPINVSNPDDCDLMTFCTESSDTFAEGLRDKISRNLLPKKCECDVVPICHVKMLVESIENKLIQSHCTCDSLVANVCPIHSSRDLQ